MSGAETPVGDGTAGLAQRSSTPDLGGYLEGSVAAISALSRDVETIERMARGILRCQLSGGKILVGGNGGSCADAEHFVGELTCTFKSRSRRAFSAVSLTAGASAITAWANDFGFESYFARQVDALGAEGDILFLISTGGGDAESGASMNLVHAAQQALDRGMEVYALAGKTGGELSKMSQEFIKVASFTTSHIQEAHITIIHAICLILDDLVEDHE